MILVFSDIHDWQDDTAVKQILVFPNEFVKIEFDKVMQKRIAEQGIEDASDSGIGAMYKLRAVKEATKDYAAVIRCGVTGKLLWEDVVKYNTPESALVAASFQLRDKMIIDINTMVSNVNCNL